MKQLNQYLTPEHLPGNESVRVAMLLKLKEPLKMNDLGLADRVANGFSINTVDAVMGLIDSYKPDAIYSIISASTLQRARKKRVVSREISERLYDIGRVIDQAALVFHGDQERIARFMMRPNPLLEQRTPYEITCSSSAGANTVINLLAQAQAGVAA